ncbi:hypothetical protein O181_031312 [Austropuccinia psidii MF-1]|uniref:Uncharacterized protein n=1 Tax=Austropuccinia psidii MF-1 TaxID=1389203 RepID=A0A9Q3D0E3_9BASI|nr:hypothetical protein [Austropuccinia psidii MF-1]
MCHFFFVGKKPFHCSGPLASKIRRFLWSKKDEPFGKGYSVSEVPTTDGTSGYSNLTGSRQRDVARWTNFGGPIPVGGRKIYYSSEVPISRINTEFVLKRIRWIANSPPDPDAAGSAELDGVEVEVVHNSIGHQSSTSPPNPPAKGFQIHIIPSTPRTFQLTLANLPTSLPPSSPSSSTARPALIPEVRPSPIVTSQHLQPVASSSRRREEISPLPFPSAQVFQQREHWPIQVTRKDPKTVSDNQDAMERYFRRVDRNIRELSEYSNDRTIPGTASEEMAARFSWYEDELMNDFQKTFDHLCRDN